MSDRTRQLENASQTSLGTAGLIVSGIVVNLLTDTIKDSIGRWSATLISIAFWVAIIGGNAILQRRQRRQDAAALAEKDRRIEDLRRRLAIDGLEVSLDSPPRKGLIVLVSQQPYKQLVARDVILHHLQPSPESPEKSTLQHLWLIHTTKPISEPQFPPESQSSWKNARDLHEEFKDQCTIHYPFVEIQNENDVAEVFRKAMNIYEDAKRTTNLQESDIVADITGGNKPMTIGLAFAGLPLERNLQYSGPVVGSPKVLIQVNFVQREASKLLHPDSAALAETA